MGLFEQAAERYIKTRGRLFALMTAALLAGVLFGSLTASSLSGEELRIAREQIEQLEQTAQDNAPAAQAARALAPTFAAALACGFFAIGAPFAAGLLGTRGFVLGYAAGMVLRVYGFSRPQLLWGRLMSYNLLMLPLLLFACVESGAMCLAQLRMLTNGRERRSGRFTDMAARYLLKCLLFAAALAGLCFLWDCALTGVYALVD